MSGILRTTILFGLLYALVSCGVFYGTKKRAERPLYDVQKLVDPTTGREVVFVWMQHLSSDKGYAEIRNFLDSLKNCGYVTFCEGVIALPFHIDTLHDLTTAQAVKEYDRELSRTDSMRLDTLYRKCRRMLGFMLGEKGYADPENGSVKLRNNEKNYVSQDEVRLGLTTDKDLWVDYSMQDIVEVCERRYGEIPLTDYDFQTGLYEKYTPAQWSPQQMRSYFTIFARNDHLARRIAGSEHPKIAVVYGAGHSFGVLYYLKKDHGFRKDRSYKAK